MAGYPTIRDYIETQLNAVSGIGVVMDYFRFLRGKTAIEAALFKSGILNCWFIQKIAQKDTWDAPGSLLRTHLINLLGYIEIDDASENEKTFLLIIDGIISKFQSNYTWGGLIFQLTPPVLTRFNQRGFANIMCHHAIITLQPIERVTI